MARVNILKQVKTANGWRNIALRRDARKRIKWTSAGRYIIEWREEGRRQRQAAGVTPAEAVEAQKQKRLELAARASGLQIEEPVETETAIPLNTAIAEFIKDIRTFRKPLTTQKYDHILGLFSEHVAHKSDVRAITVSDIKGFLAWRKSKGFDPGTTLYTDRVILHNFFNRFNFHNPVKDVPRLTKFRKHPVAYTDEDLKKFFGACEPWDKAFFALTLATGLRRGELQTLHWSDLDLTHGRVHVRAKPQYDFLPKDWEERIVPFSQEVADILRKHPRVPNCALVFPSPKSHLNYRYLHDRCKQIAKAAGLDEKEWHLHKFRDSAATRWLRVGIDVRTVQA
jgi:integrase/recombinase XerD